MSWIDGNRATFLENGEEFFPAVFDDMRSARTEILLETFILGEDRVGHALADVLVEAADRGVRVEVTVDAWGSMGLSERFLDRLTSAGVCVHLFEEKQPRWLLRVSWFRRLHRKLVVVDGCVAFVGGINFSADHLTDFGEEAKQDYAVRVTGPIVREIHDFARQAIESVHHHDGRAEAAGSQRQQRTGDARAVFIVRDNRRGRRTAIERHFRHAIRHAQRRLVIANAYFFPGHLLLREIRNAARRGVDVRIITPAATDMRIARFGARLLYDYLMRDGVRIYEYERRQLHAKVAVIDDDWVSVGSSNLDPLSLWFNLEANVVLRDEHLNRNVTRHLHELIENSCRQVSRAHAVGTVFWRVALGFLAFHFLRRFPRLAGMLPAHRPRLTPVPAPEHGRWEDEAA